MQELAVACDDADDESELSYSGDDEEGSNYSGEEEDEWHSDDEDEAYCSGMQLDLPIHEKL
jgi:hypothetical protein